MDFFLILGISAAKNVNSDAESHRSELGHSLGFQQLLNVYFENGLLKQIFFKILPQQVQGS